MATNKTKITGTQYQVTWTDRLGNQEILGHYGSEEDAKNRVVEHSTEQVRKNIGLVVGKDRELSLISGKYNINPKPFEVEVETPLGAVVRPLNDARGRRIVWTTTMVKSETDPLKVYTVGLDRDNKAVDCECPAYIYSQAPKSCKHMAKVKQSIALTPLDTLETEVARTFRNEPSTRYASPFYSPRRGY